MIDSLIEKHHSPDIKSMLELEELLKRQMIHYGLHHESMSILE